MPPDTYADVVAQNRQALAQAVLGDPNSHFPYKYDAVTDLVDQAGLPMGPGVPEERGQVAKDGADDASRTIEDYMSQGIADASRDYIEAQAAYLESGTGESLQAYNTARDRLQAARLDHRQNRGEGFVVGAAARRAG
jgi:hypothetical protein